MNGMLSREHRRVTANRWYSRCPGSSSKPAFFAEKPSRQVVHCGCRSPPYAFARPNNWRQRLKMTQAEIVCDDPQLGPNGSFVASPNEAMTYLGIGREKLYQLLNDNKLESYREGTARKITWPSIRALVKRRLAAEAARRGKAA
jgi:excisionase family DNA binding protein